MSARSSIAFAFASVLASAALAAACTQTAGLDVHYAPAQDGGAAGDAAASASEGGAVASEEGGAGAACPCDATKGLGCCLPKGASAAPYCAPNDGACERALGVFLECTKSDPSTESVCCWSSASGGATPTTAALASSCGARAQSCASDGDCAGGAKCHVTPCEGLSIGVCGDGVAPSCPASQ
jgi:hypothetical protein